MKNLLGALILSLFVIGLANGQEKSDDPFEYFRKLEYFNRIADSKQKELVFALYQFNGLYRGGYTETKLDKSGIVFTQRVSQFARQATQSAKLNESQTQELRQKLIQVVSSNCDSQLVPQADKLYSALVLQTEKEFRRCNFVGEIPAELQSVRNFLNIEYKKAEDKFIEELQAKEKIARAKYGDWEKNPGFIRYASSGYRSLKGENSILLFLRGKNQPVTEKSQEFPLYYALVSYPTGYSVGGAGGGTWSFEPFSRNGITWRLQDNSLKQLLVEYRVIENSIYVDDKSFQLQKGNLFIIKFDENWQPKIRQLNDFVKDSIDVKTVLPIFEKELGKKMMFIE